MKGTIVSFRRGRHLTSGNQMLLEVEGVDSKEKAEKLVGKSVVWKSSGGKEIKGKVSAAHGGKGIVRAIFETGMPGQSLVTNVEIK